MKKDFVIDGGDARKQGRRPSGVARPSLLGFLVLTLFLPPAPAYFPISSPPLQPTVD